MDRPLEPRPIDSDSESESDDDNAYVVREGAVRSIDSDDVTNARDEGATEESAARESLAGGVPPDPTFGGPPQMRESVDVVEAAPDGTSIARGSLTSPTGESVGGSGLSDAIQSRAGEMGGDALGRGIDFDPLAPGTNDSAAGGTGGGDADLDRMLMGHDGSLMSKEPKKWVDDPPSGGTPKPTEDPPAKGWVDRKIDEWFGGDKGDAGTGDDTGQPRQKKTVTPKTPEDYEMENPEGDAVDSATNLERVTVMQGSRGQPSNNPDDPGTDGTDTGDYIPPRDLVTNPGAEETVAPTTLTTSASLGSSPVTNPTDPAVGDDGIIRGATYGGGPGSGGGGETMPMGMVGDDSAAAGAGGIEQKTDVNGASIDMVTGQVIGSSAPASGGELAGAGGSVSQGEDGDDDDGGTQSFGTSSAFATVVPVSAGLAASGMVSQGEEGDEDESVQSLSASDAGLAIGGDTSFAGGAPTAPAGLEGPPVMGEDGPVPGGED